MASQGFERVKCTHDGESLTYQIPPPRGGILLLSVLLPGGAIAFYLQFLIGGPPVGSHVHTSSASSHQMITAMIVFIIVASFFFIVVPTWTAFKKPQLVRIGGGELEIVGPGLRRLGTWRAKIAEIENVDIGVAGGITNTRLPIILAWANYVRVITRDREVKFGRTLTENEQHWLVDELRARVRAEGGQGIDTSGADDVVERTYKNL